MVISEYITSGILEQYVSGTASPQERQEVECMSKIYPEIKEELTKIEIALEGFALASAVTPPASLKARIFEAIDNQVTETVAEVKPEPKVVALQPSRRPMYLAAASVAALVGLSIVFWMSNQTKQQQLADLQQRIEVSEKLSAIQRQDIAVMSNPDNKIVVLSGVPQKDATASMRVYWNQKSKELYIGQLNLPTPAADKQYQLWALANGKPIDMGVFDSERDAILKMKPANVAQAFAVTLEPKGGSVSPTLSEMYVIGNI